MYTNKKKFTILALTMAIAGALTGCNDGDSTSTVLPNTAKVVNPLPSSATGTMASGTVNASALTKSAEQLSHFSLAGKNYTMLPSLYSYAPAVNNLQGHRVSIIQHDDTTSAVLDPIFVSKTYYDGSGTPDWVIDNIIENNKVVGVKLKFEHGLILDLYGNIQDLIDPVDSGEDANHDAGHQASFKSQIIALFGHHINGNKYYITNYELLDIQNNGFNTANFPDEVEGVVLDVSYDGDQAKVTLNNNIIVTYDRASEGEEAAAWDEITQHLTIGRYIQAIGNISSSNSRDVTTHTLQATEIVYPSLSTMTQTLDTEGFIVWASEDGKVIKLDHGTTFLLDDATIRPSAEHDETITDDAKPTAIAGIKVGQRVAIESIYHPAGYRLATKIAYDGISQDDAESELAARMNYSFTCAGEIATVVHDNLGTNIEMTGCSVNNGTDTATNRSITVHLTDDTLYLNNIDPKQLSTGDKIKVAGYIQNYTTTATATGSATTTKNLALVVQEEQAEE